MTSPSVPTNARPEPVSNADQASVANERMAKLAQFGNANGPTKPPPALPPAARFTQPQSIKGAPLGMIAQDEHVTVQGLEFEHSILVIVRSNEGGVATAVIPKPAGL